MDLPIEYELFEGRASCIRRLEPLFAQLDSFFQKYNVTGPESGEAESLRRKWQEFKTLPWPLSLFERLTHWKTNTLARQASDLIDHLRSQDYDLSEAELAKERTWKTGLDTSPGKAVYPLVSVVVESNGRKITVTFAPGGHPAHHTDTCEVFLGHDETGQRLALKQPQLNPESLSYERDLRRIERETRFWLDLKHKFVLPFLGTCTDGPHVYLVSPYMDNGTLGGYVVNNPNADAPRLLREVGEALEFLHQKGVIHGDLKPNNVLISGELRAQVCDFGLSSLWSTVELSKTVNTWGARSYKSPELLNDVDPRKTLQSDVYAYGIMIAAACLQSSLALISF